MLKTLMAEVDGKPVCVVVPSDREVSMKKLASAFHGKSANMMKPADAERLTGIMSAASARSARKRPCRQRSRSRACRAAGLINGGQRGLQVRLDPRHALKALKAVAAPLIA